MEFSAVNQLNDLLNVTRNICFMYEQKISRGQENNFLQLNDNFRASYLIPKRKPSSALCVIKKADNSYCRLFQFEFILQTNHISEKY